MRTSPLTNKMVANDDQLKLTNCDYRRFFNVNTGNAIKISDAGGWKVMTREVPDKQTINLFG